MTKTGAARTGAARLGRIFSMKTRPEGQPDRLGQAATGSGSIAIRAPVDQPHAVQASVLEALCHSRFAQDGQAGSIWRRTRVARSTRRRKKSVGTRKMDTGRARG